jgi:hypothetical protein
MWYPISNRKCQSLLSQIVHQQMAVIKMMIISIWNEFDILQLWGGPVIVFWSICSFVCLSNLLRLHSKMAAASSTVAPGTNWLPCHPSYVPNKRMICLIQSGKEQQQKLPFCYDFFRQIIGTKKQIILSCVWYHTKFLSKENICFSNHCVVSQEMILALGSD